MPEECPDHEMDADELFVSIPFEPGIKKLIGMCSACHHAATMFVVGV